MVLVMHKFLLDYVYSMQVQLDFVILASAFSSIGGFFWLLRYESHASLTDIQNYKKNMRENLTNF